MFAYSQASCPQMLLGSNLAGDVGYTVAVLPQALSGSGLSFSIQDVLTRTDLNASIVFLQQPVSQDPNDQQTFVNAVLAFAKSNRVIAWTPGPTWSATQQYVTLQGGGGTPVSTNLTLTIQVGPTFEVLFQNGLTLTPLSDSITMNTTGGNSAASFSGLSSPANPQIGTQATLPFSGPNRGCLQVPVYIPQRSLVSQDPSTP